MTWKWTLFLVTIVLIIGTCAVSEFQKARNSKASYQELVTENNILKICFKDAVEYWRCGLANPEMIEWASDTITPKIEILKRFSFDTYTKGDSICFEKVYKIRVNCARIKYN